MAKPLVLLYIDAYSRVTANSHRATSVDDELYKAHMEPLTPSKSRKGSVFGSIEKMFNMLTPKKQRNSSSDGPRKVKVTMSMTQVQ